MLKTKIDYAKQFDKRDYSELLNKITLWAILTIIILGVLIFLFSIDGINAKEALKCFEIAHGNCIGDI